MAVRIAILLAAMLAAGAAAGPAAPVAADPLTALDAQSRASDQAGTGMAAAQRLSAAGDALAALAALERVMIAHPEAHGALLQHASLLCRLNDRAGAKIEFDQLTRSEFPAAAWANATAPCGGSPTDYGWSG
jgi:hypothetical protein